MSPLLPKTWMCTFASVPAFFTSDVLTSILYVVVSAVGSRFAALMVCRCAGPTR